MTVAGFRAGRSCVLSIRKLTAYDAHAEGEPGRVIVAGVDDPPGATVYDKMVWLRDHDDGIRKLMLREPRGYPALCANVIVSPTHPEADAGFVIMEQTEYPAMSGTNTICVATVLLETGMIEMHEPVTEFNLEAPAGLVHITAKCHDGKATEIKFRNVPAFVAHLDTTIDVPHLGPAIVDVAFGGMWYVIAEAAQFGIEITPANGRELARISAMLRQAAAEQLPVIHPVNEGIAGVSISMLTGPPTHPDAALKNVVTVASGQLHWDRPATWTGAFDRSPCGTATCAEMAVLHAKGQLGIGEPFVNESIIGTLFTGALVEQTTVGDRPAVVPTIAGQAWITGRAEYLLDPTDPFPEGYTVGDIWA